MPVSPSIRTVASHAANLAISAVAAENAGERLQRVLTTDPFVTTEQRAAQQAGGDAPPPAVPLHPASYTAPGADTALILSPELLPSHHLLLGLVLSENSVFVGAPNR